MKKSKDTEPNFAVRAKGGGFPYCCGIHVFTQLGGLMEASENAANAFCLASVPADSRPHIEFARKRGYRALYKSGDKLIMYRLHHRTQETRMKRLGVAKMIYDFKVRKSKSRVKVVKLIETVAGTIKDRVAAETRRKHTAPPRKKKAA